jgi:hypothetical protein
MDRHVEAAPHRVRHAGPGRRLVLDPPLRDEVQDRVGAFVSTLRPPRPRQEPGKSSGGEGRVRDIEGLATRPEGRGHGRDGPAVDTMAAQHLVLHLHVIPAIEELMLGEGRVLHALGAGMERAGRAERRGFSVLGGPTASWGRHDVTVIMYDH